MGRPKTEITFTFSVMSFLVSVPADRGMTGQATFRHDDNGAIFSLDYEFPDHDDAELETEVE